MTQKSARNKSVMENVWMTRKTLEDAKKKLKSKVHYERQTTVEEIKMNLNPILIQGFGCFMVLLALALIFNSITWTSETFNIDEVPLVIAFISVILLFILLFS